jgi:hypothetical protein
MIVAATLCAGLPLQARWAVNRPAFEAVGLAQDLNPVTATDVYIQAESTQKGTS